MQYVGRAIGSVSKTWSSINPATLSGAIDVIVVEHPDGSLACSPFHVRFGKFRILKPSQKKVEVIINGKSTNIPMKLGDSGEAYFVFETSSSISDIPSELLASPVVSALSSPPGSPNPSTNDLNEDGKGQDEKGMGKGYLEDPDFLDINSNAETNESDKENEKVKMNNFQQNLNKKLTQIHIPSKIDNNGDLLLDIEGYKPDQVKMHDTDEQLKKLLQEELGANYDISSFIREDQSGNIRIINPHDASSSHGSPPNGNAFNSEAIFPHSQSANEEYTSDTETPIESKSSDSRSLDSSTDTTTTETHPSYSSTGQNYIRTIRLTSDQLKCLDLKYGENDLEFSVDQGKAIVKSKLYVWRWDIPIVISDIDGTITKSDAMGHVMNLIGKDWTHIGVAKLFSEIYRNGYNIMYLTARSAGQADSTRGYLDSVVQNGYKLPKGPVLLSPDRTMAALRREVILKKPEVFKIACLNDIRSIFVNKYEEFHQTKDEKIHDDSESDVSNDTKPTPFYAGFGNRITDALSYRTVGIQSSRIFTINPDGEVHMELLELAGYRSSYVHINELVDQFFPPVKPVDNNYDARSITSMTPGSPINTSLDNIDLDAKSFFIKNTQEEKFTDANFWRDPLVDLDNLSDISEGGNDDESDINRSTPGTQNDRAIGTRDEIKSDNGSYSSPDSKDILNGNGMSSTPIKNIPNSKGQIGNQIYLELGSPISSPKFNYLSNLEDVNFLKNNGSKSSTNISIEGLSLNSGPVHPVSGVSKVNIMEDGQHHSDSNHSDYEEPSDDEFDEDEFI
ncbi:hypothetical protein Kpol_1043p19 [Vanderwaltozyma polyspora DSM 70294]|uniref:LNS2/PITP domain-containing protein n=1 Tax=Vanderwaltozyma polyspora (strain ATCC 22028 / DSM 70294 / BCRC 21397 / CBS 2163 / NBRC 10782 / NRRL Y-8283 / UCD 57-17) TaxID=436907 RepID=A7TIN7_VANPO|nr:uncharacterized protein Kpol_1043p19 [Vanderwaltozyma polyspora DSM 70294]EDO17829.1 hypothetical protein Kpol_1043p19 [Vanderwaltozyma polyspora DSM 70294]